MKNKKGNYFEKVCRGLLRKTNNKFTYSWNSHILVQETITKSAQGKGICVLPKNDLNSIKQEIRSKIDKNPQWKILVSVNQTAKLKIKQVNHKTTTDIKDPFTSFFYKNLSKFCPYFKNKLIFLPYRMAQVRGKYSFLYSKKNSSSKTIDQ